MDIFFGDARKNHKTCQQVIHMTKIYYSKGQRAKTIGKRCIEVQRGSAQASHVLSEATQEFSLAANYKPI